MTILQLVSCRGWSSDAYWAARVSVELERAGHEVTLVCRRGTGTRVIDRAREAGVRRIETLELSSGVKPASDARDVAALMRALERADVVHVHRGKEHWLAAAANRLSRTPRPLVRTRHIVQAIRPHALNRWLYRAATALVVTVTEAIRRQYLAAGLLADERVVALPGGVDALRFRPGADGAAWRRALGVGADTALVGLVGGFRVMKGHRVAIAATASLLRAGRDVRLVFVGQGGLEAEIRGVIAAAGLGDRVSVTGFEPDVPAAMAALDVALYPALESDGMSRVLFEYLATGIPVVASRVGVVPEVLEDGETALLVPAGEPDALAQAIGRMLDDRALAATIASAGARLVQTRLSGARVAEVLAGHYARLREPGAPGRDR